MRALIAGLTALASTSTRPVLLDAGDLIAHGLDEQDGRWEDQSPSVSTALDDAGHLAVIYPNGLLIFPGVKCQGREEGSWAEQGVCAAEDAVIALLSPVRTNIPRIASQLLQHADRDSVLAPFRLKVAYFGRGISAAGKDGVAAEQEAEETIWRGFVGRLKVLSGSRTK